MASLQYSNYAGWGELAKDKFSYSQAVRVGQNIEASGQGGWHPETFEISDDLATEIEQAFANVDLALRTAGGTGWDQVYKVRSYHVSKPGEVVIPQQVTEMMANAYRKWMPNHQPLWTEVGVAALGAAGMNVEIEVIAFAPEPK